MPRYRPKFCFFWTTFRSAAFCNSVVVFWLAALQYARGKLCFHVESGSLQMNFSAGLSSAFCNRAVCFCANRHPWPRHTIARYKVPRRLLELSECSSIDSKRCCSACFWISVCEDELEQKNFAQTPDLSLDLWPVLQKLLSASASLQAGSSGSGAFGVSFDAVGSNCDTICNKNCTKMGMCGE